MLCPEQVAEIEKAYRDGKTIRWAAADLGRGTGTIKKYYGRFERAGFVRETPHRKPYKTRRGGFKGAVVYDGPDWIGKPA